MATKKNNRRFWLGELKRAKLEKDLYIKKMMKENFSSLDSYDPDATLSAMEFCEGSHRHFLTTFEIWINDNYPGPAKAPQLFDEILTGSLQSAKIFKQAFGEHFNIKKV